jgi:hypothetical protein
MLVCSTWCQTKGPRGVAGVDLGTTSTIATSNYIVLDTDEANQCTSEATPYADHVSYIIKNYDFLNARH